VPDVLHQLNLLSPRTARPRSARTAAWIIPCSDLPKTSNNITQKGLAFVREPSGSVTVRGTRRASGSFAPPAPSPRWGFGGAARRRMNRMEIPMPKPSKKSAIKYSPKSKPKRKRSFAPTFNGRS
jgi:hypothetical protein